MTGRKIKIKITETFEKQVEVTVPRNMLNSDALCWVRDNLDTRILYATSSFGIKDAGSDMDYKKIVEVMG